MYRYLRIFIRFSLVSLATSFASRLGAVTFIVAKLLRFGFFIATILILMRQTQVLSDYTSTDVLLVFLTFTVIDSLSQLFFREVYRFRSRVMSGDFDFDLIKPMKALFRPLLGGIDVFDAITIVPYLIALTVVLYSYDLSFLSVSLYILLLINALIIAASFHILVLALGIVTSEIDHAVMVYRDITSLGRFPTDIYNGFVRGVLTFLVPIVLMVTVPAKLIIGTLSPGFILLAFALSGIIAYSALAVWRLALSKYTSASS
jgi:ABC-2 type transport system permease protein